MSIPVIPLNALSLKTFLLSQSATVQLWVKNSQFSAAPGAVSLIPDAHGGVEQVLVGMESDDDFWALGACPTKLPAGEYHIDGDFSDDMMFQMSMSWQLGAYQFDRYKKAAPSQAVLRLAPSVDPKALESMVTSITLIRDLINTPTEDMAPAHVAAVAKGLCEDFGADYHEVLGNDLVKQNYPLIHAVGRASHESDRLPRLVDVHWGDKKHPLLTLVGKGVCYDTGGLSMKSTKGMILMKKDMGGVAHVLGLARLIMAAKLPVHLRLLLPLVENAVGGDSFRPGDVFTARNGVSVEITNTDAEGRLVLADALAEAAAGSPDLLMDFATLTGAARVAMGPDITPFFTTDDAMAAALEDQGLQTHDLMWRLPLYAPYQRYLKSDIADMTNASTSGYAGASVAATFLSHFAGDTPWVHVDVYGWRPESMPGRPKGGDALALRAVWQFLCDRF
jgi:leucyl aminopeptidase